MTNLEAVEQQIIQGASLPATILANHLLEKAYSSKASDIHICPQQGNLRIRFRVDGILQDRYQLPTTSIPEIISRIKVLAGLRTDEHQATQDGRFRHVFSDGTTADIRVSIAPTYHGENAVLRLLFNTTGTFDLMDLGFNSNEQEKILKAIRRPNGMVLVTGPTGSGKTTTLYSLLKMLNSNQVSIVTIEDPIEYAIEGVEQIQANHRTGLTFANGLRTILRQDPNIIMVGEIRDAETAGLAVNTALTGHLLLSTLHTNDAATTLPRLLDMKIEPFLVASTINLAIGQRLVRKLCQTCKQMSQLSALAAKNLSELTGKNLLQPDEKVWQSKGCPTCNNTGYMGRICIHEVLVVEPNIREAILNKSSANHIRQLAIQNGMTTMLQDGLGKVKKGQTTMEELIRVIYE